MVWNIEKSEQKGDPHETNGFTINAIHQDEWIPFQHACVSVEGMIKC